MRPLHPVKFLLLRSKELLLDVSRYTKTNKKRKKKRLLGLQGHYQQSSASQFLTESTDLRPAQDVSNSAWHGADISKQASASCRVNSIVMPVLHNWQVCSFIRTSDLPMYACSFIARGGESLKSSRVYLGKYSTFCKLYISVVYYKLHRPRPCAFRIVGNTIDFHHL